MKHYILKFIVQSNDYWAEKMTVSDSAVTTNHLDGTRYNNPDLNISLLGTRGTLSGYIGNLYGLDIVSEEIKELFTEYGKDFVECYKVGLQRKSAKQFYFINILDNIYCFDFENSVYEEYGAGSRIIRNIDRLVLNEERISGRHFFRISELPFEIIVSEAFKLAMEDRGIDIVKFTPVDAFKFDPTGFDWNN